MEIRNILFLILILTACSKTELPEPESYRLTGTMLDMINEVNPGYKFDSTLYHAALMQAIHMDSVKNIDHNWSDGTKLSQRLKTVGFVGSAGECTAFGNDNEKDTFLQWLNSEGHRRIIMMPYNRVGYANSGRYWCLVVGTWDYAEIGK
jgi:uncharacterized protein YkwD